MTFIQANGKLTSAATDSTGAKLIKTDCPICTLKRGHEWILSDKRSFVLLNGGRNYDGNIYLVAVGEYDEERYYPKYCPECGRKLHY